MKNKYEIVLGVFGIALLVGLATGLSIYEDQQCATPMEIATKFATPDATLEVTNVIYQNPVLTAFFDATGFPFGDKTVRMTVIATGEENIMAVPEAAGGCAFLRDGTVATDEDLDRTMVMQEQKFLFDTMLQEAEKAAKAPHGGAR